MRWIMLVVTGCYLQACSLGSGNSFKSQWLKLEEASSVSCESWPMGERDLSVSEIFALASDPQGFLVTGLQRSGQPLLYYLPYKGGVDVSGQDARLLRVPRSATVLGLIKDRNKELMVIYATEKGKGYLEARDPMTNVIVSKTIIGSDEDKAGYILQRGLRSFVILEDEAGIFSVFESRSEKGKIQFHGLSLPKFDSRPQIELSNVGHAYIAWQDGKSIKGVIMQGNGSMSRPLNVWAAPDDIESWTITTNKAHFSVHAVTGNSLVGSAVLNTVQLNEYQGSIKVLNTDEHSIPDTHLGELFHLRYQVSGADHDHLLLQQWVDEESTIALYGLTANGVKPAKYSGVFDRNMRVYSAFARRGEVYTIMRQKKYDLWEYTICELDD